MPAIPSALQEQFEEYLRNKPIPNSSRGDYKKWLRYYLNFCRKYNYKKKAMPHPSRDSEPSSTVHDGKGQKDRTVPLPEKILPELRGHLESLKGLHKRDLKRKYAGVFLVNALEQKYKNAA